MTFMMHIIKIFRPKTTNISYTGKKNDFKIDLKKRHHIIITRN